MLIALKGLITRQPDSPGLLCLAAHMVHSLNPIDAGWEFASELSEDASGDIAETVAIAEAGGTDVIDSIASGIDAETGELVVMCPPGTTAWIEHARSSGRSVIVVMAKGSRLPTLLWGRFSSRYSDNHEVVDGSSFDDAICASGITPLAAWRPDCPDVAEVARF